MLCASARLPLLINPRRCGAVFRTSTQLAHHIHDVVSVLGVYPHACFRSGMGQASRGRPALWLVPVPAGALAHLLEPWLVFRLFSGAAGAVERQPQWLLSGCRPPP